MKPRAQKITVIIVFLLVLLFGVGQFFARSPINTNPSADNSPTEPPATEVVQYVPGVPASSTPVVQGSCWTNSIAAQFRADAWRCAVGNGIQDPCFQIGGSTSTLLCGFNPKISDSSSTFILSLTKPLPPPQVVPSSTPSNMTWLVELQDGTLCSRFTGTLPIAADGEAAEYGCAPQIPGGPAWDIFGDLNASSGLWTAEIGMLSASTSTFPPPMTASSVVPVATVWQ